MNSNSKEEQAQFDYGRLTQVKMPQHVGIIMDGNGRWAKQQGKARTFGHTAGVESVRAAVRFAAKQQIKALTLYAFSSENWQRPQEEVSLLMKLFMLVLRSEVKRLHSNNIRLRVIGDKSGFSYLLQKQIAMAEARTANNTGLVLNIAANYGGRWEIVEASKKLAEQVKAGELASEDITETALQSAMPLSDVPELDLMIRTGGEERISNFLLWHAAYCEFYFTETLWPDFNEQAFAEAVLNFSERQRRFGKISEQLND